MKENHDLGDCEKWDGFLCEECRIEYMTRFDDIDFQDDMDEQYVKADNFQR